MGVQFADDADETGITPQRQIPAMHVIRVCVSTMIVVSVVSADHRPPLRRREGGPAALHSFFLCK